MNIKTVENVILGHYSVNGYINLFKLVDKEKKFMINTIINEKIRLKLKSLIDSTELKKLNIKKRYKISDYTIRYWFGLKNKVPLSLILDILTLWHSENKSSKKDIMKDVEFFLRNFKEFSCMGSFDTKLPKKFSKDLFYMVGLIMGDGSLPIKFSGNGGRQYEIYIEKANYPFIKGVVEPLLRRLFQIKNIKIIRELHNINKIRYRVFFKSRIVYEFLTKIFDIPAGKKSHVIRFPMALSELSIKEKMAFFAGLVDTDWGRIRWNRFGTHMSSRGLSDDYKMLFRKLGLELKIKKYIQKNKYISYQCYMNKGDELKLFDMLKHYYPLKNTKRIKTISAGVAESGSKRQLLEAKLEHQI